MSVKRFLGILGMGILMTLDATATKNINKPGVNTSVPNAAALRAAAAGCSPSSSTQDLNINNVRAKMLGGGDKWWDLTSAKYEVPKINPPGSAPSVCSIFAGAIWMGGIDAAGQLKIACMTYRQNGDDYFPGPLTAEATVDVATCNLYDYHWVVYSTEIDSLIALLAATPGGTVDPNTLLGSPTYNNIMIWPGIGNPYATGANGASLGPNGPDQPLAPFYDANGNGIYDPWNGDYPVINPDCGNTYGDQMIFWVYNDEGNIHTETGGQAIGVMVGELAFAFSTSDELNSATFYRYNITNRANIPVGAFYMGEWVDPDLGCYTNDYVGCDTTLSLGYCYNGLPEDPDCGVPGYHFDLPIVGVDYFEGPFTQPDTPHTQLGMSTFTYYNNDFTVMGNPQSSVNYYDYMKGFWKDGSPFTKDKCDAYGGSVPTHYQFPSDPGGAAYPATWSECSCSDPVGDRRFLQASGPFTLVPGAINNITVGVVWVQQGQNVQQGCDANVGLLKVAAQKAQALFNSCFKVIEGPDCPTLVIRELQDQIIITLTNSASSNNYNESYKQGDPSIEAIANIFTNAHIDTTYTFQGYAIYQLANSEVSASNLTDPSQARLVAEVDIADSIIHMINYTLDPILGLVPTYNPPQQENLNNAGITHTFDITSDLFSNPSGNLVDYQTYYYCAIAFAHNYYLIDSPTLEYQQTPYLQGNKNFAVYSAIPHPPITDQHGMIINAAYGDSIPVTRLDGSGNGGYSLDLAAGYDDSILNSSTSFYGPIVYEGNHAPISVKVVDPYALQSKYFVVSFLPTDSPGNYISYDTVWAYNPKGHTDSVKILSFIDPTIKFRVDVYDSADNTLETSDTSYADISIPNDFLPSKFDSLTQEPVYYGVSITLGQVQNVGDTTASSLGFTQATITFQDSLLQWLTGVQEFGVEDYQNWIRSGSYAEAEQCPNADPPAGFLDGFFDSYYIRFSDPNNSKSCNADTTVYYDPQSAFSSVLGGTWAPYCLGANTINAYIDTGMYPEFASPYSYGPGFTVDYLYGTSGVLSYEPGFNHKNYNYNDNTLRLLQSVNLVITPDQSKWSQCVVLEMNEDSSIADGHALKGFYRKAPSLDMNGNVIPGDSGRSYFPGYAINVETGERLNIMFGEDSWMKNENGADMLWNPTGDVLSPLGQVLFGGRHCIYVMDTRYDGGTAVHTLMHNAYDNLPDPVTNKPDSAYTYVSGTKSFITGLELLNTINDKVYDHIMWVTMPTLDTTYLSANPSLAVSPGQQLKIPTETTIRLRVRKPFMPYLATGSNQGFPQYAFSTKGLATDTGVHQEASTALDSIRVVPNPYYAYSAYETSELDNEVKITNLPPSCTISIYTVDGTLIRRFSRATADNTSQGVNTSGTNLDNSQNWNLTNTANVPIASGLYLIYINAPGLGSKVIKWFGVLRPTDLNSF